MEFRPAISADLQRMDLAIFQLQRMGLRDRWGRGETTA
jgi:acyl CoA:acetate/3-ketoacid CoA transferase